VSHLAELPSPSPDIAEEVRDFYDRYPNPRPVDSLEQYRRKTRSDVARITISSGRTDSTGKTIPPSLPAAGRNPYNHLNELVNYAAYMIDRHKVTQYHWKECCLISSLALDVTHKKRWHNRDTLS
jgi:hypothetical protein